jgi:hypothetical protein
MDHWRQMARVSRMEKLGNKTITRKWKLRKIYKK